MLGKDKQSQSNIEVLTVLHSRFLTSIAIMVMFFVTGCEKVETTGIENSGLHIYGSQKKLDLVSLEAHPDGGFLVGSNTRRNGNQEILISKYTDDLKLEWERVIGGSLDNKLFKIHIDTDHNILISGLSYGFGNDTFTLREHKFWNPYVHLLSKSGATMWENSPSASGGAGQGSGLTERNSDILEDAEGRFVFGAELFNSSHVSSVIYRVFKSDGLVDEPTFTFDYNSRGRVEAVFDNGISYGVFNYWQEAEDSTATMRMFQIIKARTEGRNAHYFIRSHGWPWGKTYENGNVGVFKENPDGGNAWAVNYVFSEEIFQFKYDLTAREVSTVQIPLPFDNVVYSNRLSDGGYLFVDSEGGIFETDSEFKSINGFKTQWQVRQIVKLFSGGYVFIGQKDNLLYLIKYDENGKIVSYE